MASDGMFVVPGSGKIVHCRGLDVVFKITDEQAMSGSFFELIVSPGFRVGAHRHSKLEELFYVVEGELDLRVDDKVLRAGPGTFMHVPQGSLHDFYNPGNSPARMLFFVSPPGHERYFEELGEILSKEGPPDTDAIAELRRKYDTEQAAPLVAGS